MKVTRTRTIQKCLELNPESVEKAGRIFERFESKLDITAYYRDETHWIESTVQVQELPNDLIKPITRLRISSAFNCYLELNGKGQPSSYSLHGDLSRVRSAQAELDDILRACESSASGFLRWLVCHTSWLQIANIVLIVCVFLLWFLLGAARHAMGVAGFFSINLALLIISILGTPLIETMLLHRVEFVWGRNAQAYEKRKRRRENFAWIVIAGLIVSILAALLVEFLEKHLHIT